jgi:hypothetical protein
MNSASPAVDTMIQFLVVLGPSALSVIMTLIGRKFVRAFLIRAAIGIIALLLLAVQVVFLAVALMMVAGYGGNPLRNPFTLAGSIGLVVSVASLIVFCVRPLRQCDHNPTEASAKTGLKEGPAN